MSRNSENSNHDPVEEQVETSSDHDKNTEGAEESETTIEEPETDEVQDNESASEIETLSQSELVKKLEDALEEINEMKDGYVRAKAEVENIQKRSQNEIISARKFAVEGFARELLSVIDSLDQAAKVEMDESSGEAVAKMKEGLELTLKQFQNVLEKFGIIEVEADSGTKFDPESHQAISMVDSDEVDPDHIISVMQKGFMLKDRLLRPAMVVIAKSG